MARHRRIESAGACYLVVVRPRMRGDVMVTDPGSARIEYSLAEAAVRAHWRVISWRIGPAGLWMAVQTREPNLSVSMQWLVSTLAARSPARARRSGALAPGRYRAVVVEPGDTFAQVGLALDLETIRAARARAHPVSRLASGLKWMERPMDRPDWFDPAPVFAAAGVDAGDTAAAVGAAYVARLQRWIDGTEAGPSLPRLDRGWILGGESFRQEIEAQLDRQASTTRGAAVEHRWSEALASMFDRLPPSERADPRVSAPWRAALAFVMKTRTTASNAWLARALGLSTPAFVSRQAAFVRNGQGGENVLRVLAQLGEVWPARLPSAPQPIPAPVVPDTTLARVTPPIPLLAAPVAVADEDASWRRFEGLE
jgi:hypothetical protein